MIELFEHFGKCPNFCSLRTFLFAFCSLTNILGYGKQAENVLKHSVTKLVTDGDELEKERQSPFFKDCVEVLDEADDLACYMVRSKKKKITDAKPVHIGVAILQWSKLLFLR